MRDLLKINPVFSCPDNLADGFEFYALGIENSLYKLIAKFINFNDFLDDYDFFKNLMFNLPIIDWESSRSTGILSLTCLAPANNTHGLGRFICDHSSRWLLPGKQLALVHVNSLAFTLKKDPSCHLYFHQQLIRVEHTQDFDLIVANAEIFTKQLKMNILTVMHARNVVMQKGLTFEEKKMIIQENIATLFGKKQKEIDRSAYDHTHRFIIKMISEEKIEQFKDSLNSLIDLRPQIFDRDLFNELQEQISTFSDEFIACRDLKHLTRLVSYEYLFRKNMHHVVHKNPQQRHLSFKLFQTKIKNSSSQHSILGIIVSMNLLRENEIFEEKHLFKALQACLNNISKVKGSFIEHRTDKNIRTFYLEIEKKDQGSFDSKELGIIKKCFPSEVKTRIESVFNPIFMPKNEEEVLKNILILSNELKYVDDIPQLFVSFQKQTENKIWFTVILLRLIKDDQNKTKQLLLNLNKKIKIDDIETKIVGNLRKKYPKEATICDVCLDKKQFIRKDFSLDLYEARRVLVSSLEELFGEIRDYNGGIISKQNEALAKLRKLLLQANIHNDFLVENYFYSLSPSYMPSIIPVWVLKKHFNLVQKSFNTPFNANDIFFEIQNVENYLLILIATVDIGFKEFITEQVDKEELNSTNITYLNMHAQELHLVGFIYKIESNQNEDNLIKRIIQSIQSWNQTTQKIDYFTDHTVFAEDHAFSIN